jgi:ABC-2 type transport system ATP-binding protein
MTSHPSATGIRTPGLVRSDAAGECAVRVQGVTRRFGPVLAVDNLSLTVEQGRTVAPDAGSIEIFGSAPGSATAHASVGAMLQDGGMMPGVLVGELLAMVRSLYATPLALHEAVEIAQLGGLEKRRVDRLSGGQSQRLRLAMALIGDPRLLVLDEPTAAMDVETRRGFWHAMEGFTERGRTILFSTHYLEEADVTADRIVMMARGRVVADGTPSAIKDSVGLRVIRFSIATPGIAGIDALPGAVSATAHGSRVELRCKDSDAALRALLAARPDAYDIEVAGVALEDAFITITDGIAA